jgi:hypothetical protein
MLCLCLNRPRSNAVTGTKPTECRYVLGHLQLEAFEAEISLFGVQIDQTTASMLAKFTERPCSPHIPSVLLQR